MYDATDESLSLFHFIKLKSLVLRQTGHGLDLNLAINLQYLVFFSSEIAFLPFLYILKIAFFTPQTSSSP